MGWVDFFFFHLFSFSLVVRLSLVIFVGYHSFQIPNRNTRGVNWYVAAVQALFFTASRNASGVGMDPVGVY